MKIWTITTDDDNGTQTAIHFTADAANAQATEIVTAWYDKHLRGDTERRDHTDWQETYELLSDTIGFDNYLTMSEHDISHHPDIAAMLGLPHVGLSPNLQAELDRQEAAYIAAARAYATDDLEFDDQPAVAIGDDEGAFVSCWKWITAEEAGLAEDAA